MGLWDDFTGASARKDLKKANAAATGFIDAGLEQGVSDYERARGRFDPYATGGGNAFNALLNATGVNGADAQQNFLANYQQDPTVDLMQQATARQMAARGLTDSGASRLASARVWNEGYNNNLNRLMQIGQQGQQAAGSQAGIDTGIGDMRFGTGQIKANQATGFGNAMAESRSTGINNLMKLGTLAVSAYTGMPTGGGGGSKAPAGYGSSWTPWVKPA